MLRKIKTQEEVDRIKKRNQILIGVVLIGLLVLSTLGYSLVSSVNDSVQTLEESGIEFSREGGKWTANYAGRDIIMEYLPSEVIDVEVSGGPFLITDYIGNVVYFVNPGEGTGEILNNIGHSILRYQEACLSENCTGDFPVKDCSSNLIIFEPVEDTSVVKNESCIYLNGDPLKASNAFIYKILKIN